MELAIGEFVVFPYGPLTDAQGVHSELKQRGIDAAVVDHAYVLSSMQLATALHRIHPTGGITASTISSSKQRRATIEEGTSRLVFVALSLTHNLDKVLQVLPPGPATSAVVVIAHRRAVTTEVRAAITEVCTARLQPPTRSVDSNVAARAEPDAEAFLYHGLAARGDASKVMQFYHITEKDVRAVKQSFTSQDIAALEDMARRCTGKVHGVDPKLLVNVRALELCVVNRLATADI